jgi:adenine phosphoribosyltransferase
MLELLRKSLESAPIVKIGDYQYFINPLQGVAPPLQPDLLIDVARAIIKIADLNVDRIVTAEAMGIHISSLVSVFTGVPSSSSGRRGSGCRTRSRSSARKATWRCCGNRRSGST